VANEAKLRQLAEKVLRIHPDFVLSHNPNETQIGGWRLALSRARRAHGTFADNDRARQVQRDLLTVLRTAGYSAKLGREERDEFSVYVKEADPPVNLLEDAARVIREREDSNQKIGKFAKEAISAS
jgi:hypothetical protein